MDSIMAEKMEILAPVSSPSLDFNDNEDLPTELSDSSDTHDEGGRRGGGGRGAGAFLLRAEGWKGAPGGGRVGRLLVEGWWAAEPF